MKITWVDPSLSCTYFYHHTICKIPYIYQVLNEKNYKNNKVQNHNKLILFDLQPDISDLLPINFIFLYEE